MKTGTATTATAPGAAIRTRRKALKMTLGQLSRASGVDVSQLSKLERGLCGTGVDTFDRIATSLGWTPAEFWRHATRVPHRAA